MTRVQPLAIILCLVAASLAAACAPAAGPTPGAASKPASGGPARPPALQALIDAASREGQVHYANTGAPEVEDRYVAAPARSGWAVWKGRLSLLAVMARGLNAFLTYTTICAFLDAYVLLTTPVFGSTRAAVLWAFALLMPIGALARFFYVYSRGGIPRRQQLL